MFTITQQYSKYSTATLDLIGWLDNNANKQLISAVIHTSNDLFTLIIIYK